MIVAQDGSLWIATAGGLAHMQNGIFETTQGPMGSRALDLHPCIRPTRDVIETIPTFAWTARADGFVDFVKSPTSRQRHGIGDQPFHCGITRWSVVGQAERWTRRDLPFHFAHRDRGTASPGHGNIVPSSMGEVEEPVGRPAKVQCRNVDVGICRDSDHLAALARTFLTFVGKARRNCRCN